MDCFVVLGALLAKTRDRGGFVGLTASEPLAHRFGICYHEAIKR